MFNTYNNLQELCNALNNGELDSIKNTNAMTELPIFGGEEPARTEGVFSWDENSLLIQTEERFKIVGR